MKLVQKNKATTKQAHQDTILKYLVPQILTNFVSLPIPNKIILTKSKGNGRMLRVKLYFFKKRSYSSINCLL